MNTFLKMDHNHNCNHINCTSMPPTQSVVQTLSEMDWERGIWNAAFMGDATRIMLLIDKSKNAQQLVNTPDNSGYTALHYAARKGHVDICKLLLENGAHINFETRTGKATPLHKAAAAGNLDTVMYLIKSGAKVDARDVDGETILHKAAGSKNNELLKVLIETYPQLASVTDSKGQLAN